MGRKVAGTCYIKADDQMFTITGGVEVPWNTKIKTPMETMDDEEGFYSETKIAPFVRLTAVNDSKIDKKKLTESDTLTVTAELANGDVYVLTGAYLSGETTASGDEGTVPLQFHGAKGVWV